MNDVHVYLDVDDVLAETTRALAELAATRFGKRVAFDDMTVFDLAVSLGLDADEHARFMAAAHEHDFLLGVAPVAGAIRVVSSWHEAGAEISVVSGRPPETHATTTRWLEHAGLPFHRLELIDKYGRYGDAAPVTLADLSGRDYSIVVEDSVEMAEFLVETTDALVLLMDRPWNRSHAIDGERIRRVSGWDDIDALVPATPRAASRRLP